MNEHLCARFTHRFEWLALSFLTLCFFVSPISVTLTTITYLLAFLFTVLFLLFAQDWQERWGLLKQNKAALSFWVLLALFFIGLTYTTSPMHLALQDLHKRHWTLITPFFIIIIVDARWRMRMINAFLMAMVLTLLLSDLKWFHIYRFHFPGQVNINGAGAFFHHIVQNFAMSIAAFMCGYRALFERLSKKTRAFYSVIFALMAINIIFMSLGRTGYIIFLLLVLYLALIRFKYKGLLIAVACGILLMSLAYMTSNDFRSRTQAMIVNYEHSGTATKVNDINQRVEMYHIAKKMIMARPWFGYGTGGIRTAEQKMIPQVERVFNPQLDYVESIYVNFMLEFGILGFVVLMGVLMTQIIVSFQLPQTERHLMQAVLIALLVGGLFNSFMVSFTISHFYSLFSAVCFSALITRK